MNRNQTVEKTVEKVFQTEGATDTKAHWWVRVVWLEQEDGARGVVKLAGSYYTAPSRLWRGMQASSGDQWEVMEG